MNQDSSSPHVMTTPKGNAVVVLTDGQNVTLHAPFVAPPGSPMSGTLLGTAHPLKVKVHGCRRIMESSSGNVAPASGDAPPQPVQFEITGRWVSLSRDARILLLG